MKTTQFYTFVKSGKSKLRCIFNFRMPYLKSKKIERNFFLEVIVSETDRLYPCLSNISRRNIAATNAMYDNKRNTLDHFIMTTRRHGKHISDQFGEAIMFMLHKQPLDLTTSKSI